jgi:4-hydroxybutyryl-CoA synthetase (ADP-forming)
MSKSTGSQTTSAFFSPKSIAVIGASEKAGVGETIFSNIRNGYSRGKVYPITPSHTTVFGITAYKSVLDVPDEIDLAVIVTPNRFVPAIMEEVGKKKINGAIIISAGFKEVGEQGAKLEKETAGFKEVGEQGAKLENTKETGSASRSP